MQIPYSPSPGAASGRLAARSVLAGAVRRRTAQDLDRSHGAVQNPAMFLKILLTIVAVAIIWFGFKYLGRVAELRARKEEREAEKPRFEPVRNGESVQDLVKCRVCSAYRSPKSGSCGRGDCPY